MSVSLNIITNVKKDIADKPIDVMKKCCEILLPDTKCNVTLTICDDKYITELNAKYRKKNSTTDVLSFPLLESDSPGNISYTALDIDPETNEVMLGDVVISIERAKAQAQEFGHSIERELSYLLVHSMLHLIGYDHLDSGKKSAMRKKEEEILAELGIGR